jgi:hypothetical protein
VVGATAEPRVQSPTRQSKLPRAQHFLLFVLGELASFAGDGNHCLAARHHAPPPWIDLFLSRVPINFDFPEISSHLLGFIKFLKLVLFS